MARQTTHQHLTDLYPAQPDVPHPFDYNTRFYNGQVTSTFFGSKVSEHFERLSLGDLGFPQNEELRDTLLAPFRIQGMPATLRFASKHPGPEVLISAGLHGNECVPISVLVNLAHHLITDPDSLKRGSVILTLGNPEAIHEGKRFIPPGSILERVLGEEFGERVRSRIEKTLKRYAPSVLHLDAPDLNRSFTERTRNNGSPLHANRDRMKCLIKGSYPGAPTDGRERIYLDLHTMSKSGEPFVIFHSEKWEEALALGISKIVFGAPKIFKGAMSGTSIDYASRQGITKAFALEAGHHDLASSGAAVLLAIRNLLAVNDMDGGLPPVEEELATLGVQDRCKPQKISTSVFRIEDVLLKGCNTVEFTQRFHNFQFVEEGVEIGTSKQGKVLFPRDGYVLLPTDPTRQRLGWELMLIADKVADIPAANGNVRSNVKA